MRALAVAVVLASCLGCGSATTPGAPSAAPQAAPTPQAAPALRQLAMNDLSVLFPLGRGELWPASMPARDGEALLPRSALDPIGVRVIRELQGNDATHAGLRVVSLRFDPCFSGSPCYPEIRLVLQGLRADGSQAFDGAFHALYNLSAEEFASVTARLKGMVALAPENGAADRLEVSPALRTQGMGGAYATALRELVAQYIGAPNLAKLTFMTRAANGGTRWDFGGFNFRDFEPAGAFPIAGLDGAILTQTTRSNGQPRITLPAGAVSYAYSVTPGALHGELGLVLSAANAQNANAADRQRAMDALSRVENPALESPDTVDCSACHLANRLRGHLQTAYGLGSAFAYTSIAEPTRQIAAAETDNDNLRAFGYFNAQPAISQRTANETLKVLEAMR